MMETKNEKYLNFCRLGRGARTGLIVRPNGADHQRGKDPPRHMLVRSGS